MRGFFNGLILGIILGAVGFWYVQKKAQEHPEAQERYQEAMTNTEAKASETISNFSDALSAKFDTLDLNTSQIKDDLKHSGEVIRRKARDIGDQAADAASDARAVTEIKAKYVADPNLSVWKISVACKHGHVTLTGTVPSPEDIGRAVALALDADGVRDVISTLKVQSDQSTDQGTNVPTGATNSTYVH
jgi:hyperosmotically inducible periplasmic protein